MMMIAPFEVMVVLMVSGRKVSSLAFNKMLIIFI